jgi:acid phosphatase
MSTTSYAVLALAALARAATLYEAYDFNPLQHLSGIAPTFAPADPPRDPAPPEGCFVTRAAYLVRHGAINMNDFDYETYIEPLIEKLNDTSVDWSSIPELAFLSDWQSPDFSEISLLTRTGRVEATELGATIAQKYQDLRLPERIWASTAERVVESAKGIIRGLEEEADTISLVEIYEGEEDGANTLSADESCDAFSSSAGSDQEEVSDVSKTQDFHAADICRNISSFTLLR